MLRHLIILGIAVLMASACQNEQTDAENMVEQKTPVRIVFFGNSLTAAYGLEPELGFVSLLEKKLMAAGYSVDILNAGISGETTEGGLWRIGYVLEKPLDILVLELGINDAFYGEESSVIKENLQKMINLAKEAHPRARILLLGIKPPEGVHFAEPQAVHQLYQELARENDLALVSDLIEKVRKRPRKYLFDDIHPNAEGHRLLAETVWPVLREVIRGGGL